MKTLLLCLTVFTVLHVQPVVPQTVLCYSRFSLSDGTCSETLDRVPFDDCCMNQKYGYRDNDGVCKSCRYAMWTEWSSWSDCTVSCASGVHQRRRACYGIGKCLDSDKVGNIQTESCTEQSCCPEDGAWSEWGAWSPCSVTCESGMKIRKRTCSDPPPKCGGTCHGHAEETEDCDTETDCPTHGGWSSWGNWGPCAGTCTVEGRSPPLQHRHRTCTNPPPSTVPPGNNCPGSSIDGQNCVALPFCAVNGGWGAWSAPTECSVTCGVGRQVQRRSCDNPAPKYGGKTCQGDDTKITICTVHTYCPVDGIWGEWNQWSKCTSPNTRSINCRSKMGRRRRVRECLAKDYGGDFCPGENVEHGTCYDIQGCKAGDNEMILRAFWSEWSEWSYCKPDCGEDSKQTREIKCKPDISKYKDQTPEIFSGDPDIVCPPIPETKQTRPCQNVPEC